MTLIISNPTLIKNIKHLNLQKGQAWLDHLPKLIEELAKKWNLSNITPVNNMSWHFVATAKKNNIDDVVLKIGMDKELMQHEYHALLLFKHAHAVSVYHYEADHCAMLLEHAVPGTSLKEAPLAMQEKIKHYAQCVLDLASQQILADDFPHAKDWLKALDRLQDVRVPENIITTSKRIREYLFNTAKKEMLFHGDLHFENILAKQHGWAIIDPKGIIAEIGFEAAAFDLISQNEMKQNQAAITALILERSQALAYALQLEHNRLLAWIFLRVVMSLQWFIEDGGDPQQMLTLAIYLAPLVSL